MKLYYAPGACSLGIHVLLEEIGKPFDAVRVNLRQGEQHHPDFVARNPKAKVPALERDDGSVLTEYPAIAYWLARSNPEAKLLPDDLEDQVRALEAIDYVVATMHMQGFSRIFRPENYAPSEADRDRVRARGREIFEKGLALMEQSLGTREFIAGSRFSIADSALLYVCLWAKRADIALPPNLQRFTERMHARPSVRRVLEKEAA